MVTTTNPGEGKEYDSQNERVINSNALLTTTTKSQGI